jgi:hypothetical protein
VDWIGRRFGFAADGGNGSRVSFLFPRNSFPFRWHCVFANCAASRRGASIYPECGCFEGLDRKKFFPS